ncbi:hypothetical protein MMC25_003047 [Agyrium rufum]|nr:hypothetical protein [Agyrium rufum]
MPIGIERINAKRQQPNSRIIFIKPLPGPGEKYAQDFLERVAAICHPVMKANHLNVMSLEEYEPNREFIGRNFNAGEVIQLVLKAPYSGHWLPFRSVVMVMMHELAHCKQMNHSGAFWKVRNGYAAEMRELWTKGYTGDGFWGRGKTVLSAEYENERSLDGEIMPEHLCGGTYRSKRGKRKRTGASGSAGKPTLSYAERQQRRIAKNFGKNGVTLGDDEDTKVKLENGKRPKGKPRVAGSARGRELRAAAALARFGQQAKEEPENVKAEDGSSGSGSESESDYETVKTEEDIAYDWNGQRLMDGHGHGLVKVWEDGQVDDVHVKAEFEELQDLQSLPMVTSALDSSLPSQAPTPKRVLRGSTKGHQAKSQTKFQEPAEPERGSPQSATAEAEERSCPICSLSNSGLALCCSACSNVLQPELVPGSWFCLASSCKESGYMNSGDCGVCGLCGGAR